MIFQLTRLALTNVNETPGRWQFEGGQVLENEAHVANFASFNRVTFKGIDQNGPHSWEQFSSEGVREGGVCQRSMLQCPLRVA